MMSRRAYLPYSRTPGTRAAWPDKYAHLRPKVIPVLEWPNGFAMNESTRIIQKVESETPSGR